MSDRMSSRLEELLIDRATVGLNDEERAELAALLASSEVDSELFELAAAAIDCAVSVETEELPDHLRQKVSAQAREFFRNRDSSLKSHGAVVEFPAQKSNWLPWLAAAAGLILAIVSWWPALQPPTAPPTNADLRQSLLAEAGDVIQVAWQTTDQGPGSGASGDVVWSPSLQKGFLRFTGLQPNDPSQEQYQLWIFDSQRDERYPVDGGVFDFPASAAESVIPISPKLPVSNPTLFAVTVEPPGGVVVSDRQRIALIAPVS